MKPNTGYRMHRQTQALHQVKPANNQLPVKLERTPTAVYAHKGVAKHTSVRQKKSGKQTAGEARAPHSTTLCFCLPRSESWMIGMHHSRKTGHRVLVPPPDLVHNKPQVGAVIIRSHHLKSQIFAVCRHFPAEKSDKISGTGGVVSFKRPGVHGVQLDTQVTLSIDHRQERLTTVKCSDKQHAKLTRRKGVKTTSRYKYP